MNIHNKLFFLPLLLAALQINAASLPAAGFKGTYNQLDPRLQKLSPIHGAIIAENGFLKAALNKATEIGKTPLGELARIMFHELDGKIRCTVRPSNPVAVVDNGMLQFLITNLENKDFKFSSLLPKEIIFPSEENSGTLSDFGNNWWTLYEAWNNGTTIDHKRKDFKPTSKNFLKAIDTARTVDINATRDMLLAFAYLKCKNGQDLHAFFALFNPELTSDLFTKEDFERLTKLFSTTELNEKEAPHYVEEMGFWLMQTKATDLYFLRAPLRYNKNSKPLCVDDVLQTIINLVLYDPATKRLSLTHLPPAIEVTPQFKAFIEAYSNPHIKNYYQETLATWLTLTSGHSELDYSHKMSDESKTFDQALIATKENILTLLNLLFDTKAATLEELGSLLSANDRTITFTNSDDENIELQVDDLRENQGHHAKIIIELELGTPATAEEIENNDPIDNPGHAEAHFVNTAGEIPSIQTINNITLFEKILHKPILRIVTIDWYATITNFLDKNIITTGDELLKFLQTHPVTPQEIAARSIHFETYLLRDAIENKNITIIKALLEFGVPATHYPNNVNYDTPLKDARSPEIRELLKQYGAKK